MGIYQSLEDKWYDFLDKLNEKIPVYKIIDPIDKIVPSFLVLIILFFILIFLIIFVLLGVLNPSQLEANVIVLSAGNSLPLSGTKLIINSDCGGETIIITDGMGKANFNVCSQEFLVTAEKEGFTKSTKTLFLGKDNTIRLTPADIKLSEGTTKIYVKVVDELGLVLVGASVWSVCDGASLFVGKQGADGFDVVFSGCSVAQLRASALGYKDKTVGWNKVDQSVIIKMDKDVQVASVSFVTENITVANRVEPNVDVSIKDSLGGLRKILTDSSGTGLISLPVGDYNYSAVAFGEVVTGSFKVESTKSMEVKITFTKNRDPVSLAKNKIINIAVFSDANSPIMSALVNVYMDGNIFSLGNTTNSSGLITRPIPVNEDYLTNKFFVVISASGYEKKIVKINPIDINSQPTKIELKRGENKLIVKVIDDQNTNVRSATVRVINTEFNLEVNESENKTTDNNGVYVLKNLPTGNYKILVGTNIVSGETTARMDSNKETYVEVQLTLNMGFIRYNFVDEEGNKINPLIKVYKILENGTNDLLFTGHPKNGVYDSNKFFVGTKIKVIVEDENYFKTTTPIYTITKNTQNKIVPLRTLNSLPNNNEVQLILENVFSANPLYGSAVTVDSIRGGEKSYLFFSLIVNTDLNAVPIGVFYIGDKNKPTLDSNSAKIDGIYSVDYQTILSSNMSGLMIDPTNQTNIVDEDAKIGNIIFNEIKGKYALPIILEIETDENTINDVINYQAFFGTDKNSLAYKFEFTVGKKFCTNNKTCPPFLYNNYIDKNGILIPYQENYQLFIGDTYGIKTIIENTSDTYFSGTELVLSIPRESVDYALFSNDKNSVRFPLTLNPLSQSDPKDEFLEPIKNKSVFSIDQSIQKIVGGVDELRGVNNASEQKLKFSIKTKNQLEITTSPSVLDERSIYPFFVISTRIKGGGKVSTNWKVEKILSDGLLEQFMQGNTDGNGLQIISFDATNLVKGDVVRFTAFDTNGSIEGYTDVNITSKFSTVETLPQECLSISVGETNVSTNDNYFVALDKGNSQIVTVDSNCSNERTISVVSDLELSEISIIVPANSQKSFTITATPRDSLLGAYPVQVVTVNGTRYSQLAYFDVVISDSSSCFELENAVFDFREINSINSKITNNCYEGRKDNFYPKMNVSTNSVSLNYNKPGTPEDVNFTARVIGSALEVYVAGIGWATQWYQTNKGDSCRSVAQDNVVPTELYNMEDQTTECQALIDELSELKTISDLDWFTEPDLNETDPEKSYYNLPTEIQNKIISDLIAEEGSLSEIDTTTDTNSSTTTSNDDSDTNASFSSSRLNNKKTFKKLLFADATYTPENLPKSFTRGTSTEDLSFEFYPTPIGESMLEPQSSCEKVHNMDWVTAPYPENWGDCNVGECYTSIDERPIGPLEVVALSTCKPCKILSAELIEEEIRGVLYTKGETEDEALVGAGVGAVAGVAVGSFFGPWGAVIGGVVGAVGGAVAGMFIDDHETAKMTVQPEFYRNVYFVSEKKTEWEKEFTIKTTEGEVHDLGEYEATPTPSWTDLTEVKGHAVGQTWEEGSGDTNSVLLGALCGQGIGFIDVREGGEGYEVEEPSEIRVEYSSDGLIKYKIPDEAVPSDGIRVFLKNGHYYAEYIGSPEIDSEFIDFNLSKVNLVGNEYAIITVQDWVSGSEKKEAVFQVKLKGPASTCVNANGEDGYTGSEFVPRFLFKWDFSSINEEQCDSTFENYTYCDGVQFNISLFKKLAQFESLLRTQNISTLANKTTFYSYLIRDNYSDSLLDDFSYYFSNNIAVANPEFYSTPGYKKLIDENKLHFRLRNQDGSFAQGTRIPYGGLYRVEIDIQRIDEGMFSMFDGNNSNVNVTVTLMPIEKAKNYNPFYETPFDGEVGKRENTFYREDYGVTFNNTQIKLNNNTPTNNYGGYPLKTISVTSSTNLNTLSDGIVFNYNSETNQMKFNPSRPTPVVMKIVNSTTGRLSADYTLSGTSDPLLSEWTTKSSTFSNSSNSCLDFEENDQRTFTEVASGTKRSVVWVSAKGGTLVLGTTFFTPKSLASAVRVTPVDSNKVTLLGPSGTKNGSSVMISNYNLSSEVNYDDLEFLFNQVKNEQMCMSKSSNSIINIWWNQGYLDEQIDSLITNKKGNC